MYMTGMVYTKTVVKTVNIVDIDLVSTMVKWAIHCVSRNITVSKGHSGQVVSRSQTDSSAQHQYGNISFHRE